MLASAAKYRSPWIQLAVFVVLTLGIFMTVGSFGAALVAKMNGVSLTDVEKIMNGELKSSAARNIFAGMQILQFAALFLVPVILFALWADPKQPLKFAGLKNPWSVKYYGWAVLLMLVSIFVSGLAGFINDQIPLPENLAKLEAKQNAAVTAMAVSKTIPELLQSIFLVGLLAAVGEELFFRGAIQRILIQLTKSPWAGIIITALLFSAIHLQFAGFLPRLFLGIVLGAIYWYSGSLWPGILFHFLFNTLGVIAAYFNPDQLNKPDMAGASKYGIIFFGVASIAAVVYLLIVMKRNSKTEYAEVYPPKPADPFA